MTTETPEGLDFEVTHGEPVDPDETTPPAGTDDPGEETPQDPQEATSDDDETPEEAKSTRLRKRAQEAEAERDMLREQVDNARRQLVEHASTRLHKPAALWAAGTQVDDLFGDDGRLDTAALDAAITHTAQTLGVPLRPKPDPYQGARGTVPTAPVTWGDVL